MNLPRRTTPAPRRAIRRDEGRRAVDPPSAPSARPRADAIVALNGVAKRCCTATLQRTLTPLPRRKVTPSVARNPHEPRRPGPLSPLANGTGGPRHSTVCSAPFPLPTGDVDDADAQRLPGRASGQTSGRSESSGHTGRTLVWQMVRSAPELSGRGSRRWSPTWTRPTP